MSAESSAEKVEKREPTLCVIQGCRPPTCDLSHPLVDSGKPCVKAAGHDSTRHVTINGVWWKE